MSEQTNQPEVSQAARDAFREALRELHETHEAKRQIENGRDNALRELSTERAAREKLEAATVATRADRDRWEESWHRDTERLRMQLLGAESTGSTLRAQLQQAEAAVIMWRDNSSILCSKLQQAEQERDDARCCKPDEFSHVLASERAARSELSSLRAELAATQETVLSVERELQAEIEAPKHWQARAHELQKQNAALTSELAAVRICFAEASQSAGPTTVHVEKLKARNAELVNALTDWVEWWETIAPKQRGQIYLESVKLVRHEALNQSPE